MSETPIDAAHAALEAAGDDARLRMAFYGQVMAAELYLVLDAELEGERLRPLILHTEEGRLVLAFDLPERMAAFLDTPRDYVALAGRSLVAMLAGQGLGIALNPDVALSASVIGPEAVDWLASSSNPAEMQARRLRELRPPTGVSAALVASLEARLGGYAGRVKAGYLVATEYADGSEGLVLALAGVPEEGETAVAEAIDEAVRFSGVEGVRLDVLFPSSEAMTRFERVGLAFRPEPPRQTGELARNPDQPPRLR